MKRYIKTIETTAGLEPIESMARVGVDTDSNMIYYVNPDLNRIGEPYFKVYNNTSHQKANKIARISFLTPKYIEHRDESGKQPWKLNSSDRKKVCNYLNKKSPFLGVTFFQYAMYNWNLEYGFLDHTLDEKYDSPLSAYKDGFFDTEENLSHSSYLASYLVIPDYTQLH